MPELEINDLMSGDEELAGLGEELEGLGDEEILGAMNGRNLSKWLIEQPLPLGTAQACAHTASVVFTTANPQLDMLICGLVISADTDATLEPLTVTDILVGRKTQLQAGGNIPASCFRANSMRRIQLEPMKAILGMTVNITNTSPAIDAANVRVAAFGYLTKDVLALGRKAVAKAKARRR